LGDLAKMTVMKITWDDRLKDIFNSAPEELIRINRKMSKSLKMINIFHVF